jgi:hypothetical protein
MFGFCCCAGGDCTGSPSLSSYRGFPSVMFHPYLRVNQYTASKNPLNGGNGGLNTNFNIETAPNFTYDMEGHTSKLALGNDQSRKVSVLVSCHGSAGMIARRVDGNSIGQNLMDSSTINSFSASSAASGSLSYKLGSGLAGSVSFKGYGSNENYWAGSTSGMRYGFDGFVGSYGCCFYRGINYIIEARGLRGVVIWQRQGQQTNFTYNYIGLINTGNTIATKVCTSGKFLYIGTCGYKKPQTSYQNIFDQISKQPEFSEGNTGDKVQEVSAQGVLIYNLGDYIDGVIEGKGVAPKLMKNISAGHVNSIKSGSGGDVYVASSTGLKKIKRTQRVGYNGEIIYTFTSENYSSEKKVTAISILKEGKEDDVYYTVGTENGYNVYKNRSGIISGNQFANRKLCTDPYVECTEGGGWWGGGTDYSGYYIYRTNLANKNYFKRSPLPTCSGIGGQIQKTPEQIATFANGIVATKGALYVSFWGNGFAKFTKSGSLIKHYNDFMPNDCSGFKRYDNKNIQEMDFNTQHTISAGPIACAGGKVFVSESVQYVANGSGPFIYDPFNTSTNVRGFITLVRGFRPQKGLFILG